MLRLRLPALAAFGRLIKSTYKQWWDQEQEPSGDSVEHIYAGSRHLQNTDDGTNFGERWRTPHACPRWSLPVAAVSGEIATRLSRKVVNRSGAGTPSNDPPPLTHPRLRQSVEMTRPLRRRGAGLRAGRPTGEALARAGSSIQTPQRRTFSNPTTEDDQRNLYGQGKVMPKDSSGSGANWGTGIASDDPNGVLNPMNSRLDFDGTVAPTDLDRATDAREKARIGIFGSALAYAGSSPRVTSETIGRDLNPMGRGDGTYYAGGAIRFSGMYPILNTYSAGTGNSINNDGQIGYPMGECDGISGIGNFASTNPDPKCIEEVKALREQYGTDDCWTGLKPTVYCTCCRHMCLSKEQWDEDPEGCLRIQCCCRESNSCPCAGDNPCMTNGYDDPIMFKKCCWKCPCCTASSPNDANGGKVKSPEGGIRCGGDCGGRLRWGGPGTGSAFKYPEWIDNLHKCFRGCNNLYEEYSREWYECFKKCNQKYGSDHPPGPTPPGPGTFINCADIPATMRDCLFGPGIPSVPSTSDLIWCFMQIATACGCEGICQAIYPLPEGYNGCNEECCICLADNPELLAGGTETAGTIVGINIDQAKCLCDRMQNEGILPNTFDCGIILD